jgi:hypothetical protein
MHIIRVESHQLTQHLNQTFKLPKPITIRVCKYAFSSRQQTNEANTHFRYTADTNVLMKNFMEKEIIFQYTSLHILYIEKVSNFKEVCTFSHVSISFP